MDFRELIEKRYSVRAYRPDPVPEETLERVLNAARLAPTAVNRQPFRIIVVETADAKQALARVYHRSWFVQAPLVLAVVGVASEAWTRGFDGVRYHIVDATIAMDHLVLAAANEGLGTCWVCNFNPAEAREMLSLPPDVEPVAFTPLGYPADTPQPKLRRSLGELVMRGRWRDSK
jgi:nitroreductase